MLQRRAPLVVLCLLLTPAAAFGLSASQQKQYSSSASLLFRDPEFDQKVLGSPALPPSTDPDREAATNVRLVSLDAVAGRTAARIGGLSKQQVVAKLEVAAEGQSDVVSVTATDPKPEFAASLANSFAEEYIEFRRAADRSKIRDARSLIEEQLKGVPGGAQDDATARELVQQLSVLGSLQTGNAEIVQRAEPSASPSSPKLTRNVAMGLLLGGVLGVGLALLLERLDRSVRDPKELETVFDRPMLAAIPESRALAHERRAGGNLAGDEREPFRMLRANLRYFDVDRDVRSVLITSAAPGDGKTTVAWNLAAAAAEGARVLLVEADLRRPTLGEGLGLGGAPGLSTVLAGRLALPEAVQTVSVQEAIHDRPQRTLDVLLAGPLPPNPSDLLESDRMRELLALAERAYDLVVVDTPPTSVVSDAVPLVRAVAGVIVVGRLGRTRRDSAAQLRDPLHNLDAPLLGVVVNGLRHTGTGYGYGYGYQQQRKSSPRAA